MKYLICLLLSVCCINICSAQTNKKKQEKRQDVATSVEHLKLYPKEADKYVNIYVEFAQPTDFTITLLPTPLSNEKKWDLYAKSSYQQSLTVTELLPGTYTIVLKGGGIIETADFTVKR